MNEKPTYEELEQRVRELEREKLESSRARKLIINGEKGLIHKIESAMDSEIHDLGSIINAEEIQLIMDDFCHITNMVTAILDLKGNLIETTGWQDICTKFHRVNPKTAHNCTESDLFLAKNLKPGEYIDYKCKNGLWDVVTPLHVGGKHLGNIYTGQFFYDDEEIDEEFFIQQAERYGFDRDAYISAFRQIPVYSRATIAHLMGFLVKFTTYISKISLARIELQKEIKHRKKAEEALQKSEAQMRTLIDTIPDLIWLKDQEGIYLACNPNFEDFFGAKEIDIVGKTDYDFVDKDLADFFRKKDRAAMAENRPSVNEEEVTYASDGKKRVLETVKTPLYDSAGELIGVLGIARDITRRKQDGEEVRRLRSYLSNIINSMPSMLICADIEGKVTLWNRTAEKTTGIAADAAQGKTLSELLPHMYSEMEKITQSIRNREIKQDLKKPRLFKNIICYEDIIIYPLTVNGVEGAVIRVDDVTEKVRMEEMLIQSEKMLSVGGLAAGMAHEINNPLAGIIQTANVMANRLGEKIDNPANLKAAQGAGITMEAVQEFMKARGILPMIATIIKSGWRVAAIVENMLNFSRKSEVQASAHFLSDLMDRTIELAATDYNLKKEYDFKLIRIIKEYEPDLPPVVCDGPKIQQVILNILLNGAQAMEEAKTNNPLFIVRIRFERSLKLVCMEIEDNGPGMDEETSRRAFEPFYTTKPVGKGTGLGLSVSYFIITENHHGEISVESRPGYGAKFIICLPL